MEAVFKCWHRSLDRDINWRVNGTFYRNFPDITRGSIKENGRIVTDTLMIPARSEFNGTEVVCLATANGFNEETFPAKLLIMKGQSLYSICIIFAREK